MRTAPLLLLALVLETPKKEGLEPKLEEIRERYENGSTQPKEFEIQEGEANEYLRSPEVELPEGVESPWLRFEEGATVVGATVDLEKFHARLPMLFQLLSGRVPVEIQARLEGANGLGKLDLARVVLAGVELPESVVAALAQSEKATQFLPPGFRMGEPFELPYDLESIRCRVGSVLLEQRRTLLAK